MKLFYGLESELELKNPVVAVGSFDGVHQGHCRILQQVVDIARQCQGTSVVITFDPHPREVLSDASTFFRINTMEKNLDLMSRQQVDAVVVIPFTKEFAGLSYTEFMETYVFGRIHAHTLVMGPNHSMGRGRAGDNEAIKSLCQAHGVATVQIPELLFHEAGVHSTLIRKCIGNGDFQTASTLLGYAYEPTL